MIGRDQPTRFGSFDERNYITINVGGTNYTDYICLTPRPDFPGARYNSNDWLGDFEDFFREGYNDVLTKFSNPGAYLADGIAKDVGFEILNYNSNTKEYTLSLQVNLTGVLSLKPSKPQNLKVTANQSDEAVLTWDANIEPDIISGGKYKIYRADVYGTGEPTWEWELAATIDAYVGSTPVTSYTDYETYIYSGPRWLHYKITAFDNTNKESVPSDKVKINGRVPKQNTSEKSVAINSYQVSQNHPNPFNPITTILYEIKDKGLVDLSVYDILGKEVANLVNESKDAGRYSVNFDASNLPSGVYIYTLRVNDFATSKKMVVLK